MSKAIIYSSSGSSANIASFSVGSVTDFKGILNNNQPVLTWTDPVDGESSTGTPIPWAFTRIVRKVGTSPSSPNDGTVVLESSVRNQYATNGWTDTTVEEGYTYWYAAFAYSEFGSYSTNVPTVSLTTQRYRVMTVIIDENESNPTLNCSYADDAVDMPSGLNTEATDAWQEFFGYRPCLLDQGQVTHYLNPNDYTRDIDGNDADITGSTRTTATVEKDVMVEFPRRGIKISKSGGLITVSMTDNPNNPEYTYNAHTRGEIDKDYFYVSVYPSEDGRSDAITSTVYARSRSDVEYAMSSRGTYLDTAWTNVHDYVHYKPISNQESKYELLTWYQLIFIQCMFLLQFKTTNMASAYKTPTLTFDRNATSNESTLTGAMNKYGLNAYVKFNDTGLTKMFGMECMGRFTRPTWIDGCFLEDTGHTTIAYIKKDNTDFSIDDPDGGWVTSMDSTSYQKSDSFARGNGDFITKTIGNTDYGFLPTTVGGSDTTYYCDALDVNGNQRLSYNDYVDFAPLILHSEVNIGGNGNDKSKGLFSFSNYYDVGAATAIRIIRFSLY